jgi:hypothetical protein
MRYLGCTLAALLTLWAVLIVAGLLLGWSRLEFVG